MLSREVTGDFKDEHLIALRSLSVNRRTSVLTEHTLVEAVTGISGPETGVYTLARRQVMHGVDFHVLYRGRRLMNPS